MLSYRIFKWSMFQVISFYKNMMILLGLDFNEKRGEKLEEKLL